MKLLIELPSWIGDTVMATPSLVNLINHFEAPKVTLIGSFVSNELIKNNLKVISFPFSGYWLDVGKHEDFEKAQIDIQNIKF